jgi:hypothetical protein
MRANLRRALLACVVAALPAVSASSLAQTVNSLKAGAARMDITPPVADLPAPFTKINDKLFVRALVLDDGVTRTVIVVGDLPTIAADVFADMKQRIAKVSGAPMANIILAVTHTHNAVRLDNNPVGIILPGSAKITAATVAITLDAVKQAVANLQPAKAGYAKSETPLIGRRPDTAGPGGDDQESLDRTLSVLKVESMNGDPIAFLINAGLEPVIIQGPTEVSADVAGVVERYVEQRYGDQPVAMYTVGSIARSFYNARSQGSGPAADSHVIMNAVGTLLGEDALATANRIQTAADVKLSGKQTILQCPGKSTFPLNNGRSCSDQPGSKLPACVFKDTDTDPVDLQLGVVKIGDLKIVQADANITPPVWQKLKGLAPANTMLVALTYGPVHYVMADAIYPSNSYQVTASMVKAGCAEQGFINKSMSMVKGTD